MKKLGKIIGITGVLCAAVSMGTTCMAAGATTISINDVIQNSAIGGSASIETITSGANDTVVQQVANLIQNTVIGGDLDIFNISSLSGGTVVSDTTNLLNGVVTGGDYTAMNWNDIKAGAAGVSFTNLLNNTFIAGNADITNIANAYGADVVQAAINNIMSGTVAQGDYSVFNLVK